MYKLSIAFLSLTAMLLSVSATPTGPEQTCLTQCATNYTYPTRPSTPCCGCCNSNGDTCNGNGVEFSTCCRSNEDFCGCISARAFCSGSVYNSTYPTESAFGTCYPKGYGTCSYSPSPNVWIVCPTGLTGCIAGNGVATCCASGQTCNIDGTCGTSTPTSTQSNNDCGCVIATDQCCYDQATGKRCYNPSLYSCTINEQGKEVLCSKGSSSCGGACYNPSQYCCNNGQLAPAGTCPGNPTTTTTTSNPITTTTTQTTQTTGTEIPSSSSANDCGCVIPTDQCCHDQATGKRCYNPSEYACTSNNGQNVLCPIGFSSCGTACYNPTQYCCKNGNLQQPGQCGNPTTTTSNPTSTTTQTTQTTGTGIPSSSSANDCGCVIASDKCCHDRSTGKRCYNPSIYSCTTNEQGQSVLCANGFSSCGDACYNPSQYCCKNGNLAPAGSCSSTPSTCSSGETFDPASSYCCSDAAGYALFTKVCPKGQHCCGNLLNGTNYYGPGSLYTACYDPTQFQCCFGGTSAFLNPSEIHPIGYTPPQGSVQRCVQ